MASIKIDKDGATVGFANYGPAKVVVSSDRENRLVIRGIPDGYKVGDEIPESEIIKMPKIVLQFYQEESIDVMIKHLEWIKRNMKLTDFARAC